MEENMKSKKALTCFISLICIFSLNIPLAMGQTNICPRNYDITKLEYSSFLNAYILITTGIFACWYFPNGRLSIEHPLNSNNQFHGLSRLYYESGALKGEMPYINGNQEGIARTYLQNGRLSEETPYKNNQRDGVETSYLKNGQVFARITYRNDIPVSATCRNGRQWTNAELLNWENGLSVRCGN